jgi:hypothetical protein
MEYIGPPWCYWAYPMERFCSFIGASVKSKRYPYANIGKRILYRAELQIIICRYNLHGTPDFSRQRRRNEAEDADTQEDC